MFILIMRLIDHFRVGQYGRFGGMFFMGREMRRRLIAIGSLILFLLLVGLLPLVHYNKYVFPLIIVTII